MKVSDKAVVMILVVLIGSHFPLCWLVSVWEWWSIACAAVYCLVTTAVLIFLAALMIVAHERETSQRQQADGEKSGASTARKTVSVTRFAQRN